MALSPIPNPDRLIFNGTFWAVVLNSDQGLLGRCYLLLKRHETDFTALNDGELIELRELLRRAKAALVSAFAPDHFNFAALMNQEPQVHFHIVPRYRAERRFAHVTFSDETFGGHYTVAPPFTLEPAQYGEVRNALRAAFAD